MQVVPRLLVLLAPTFCLTACVVPGPAPPPERPNILLVYLDDLACNAVGAYGATWAPTPHMDRLAAAGLRFDRAFVENAICAPARATVLTGRYSHQHGVVDNRVAFDASQDTFPRRLQAAGYQTVLLGKWHLKSEPRGFEHWEVLPGQGRYYNPVLRTPEGEVRVPGYVTDVLTDRALRWLREERDPDRPFLLMLQHKAPHRNWQPGPRELDLLEDVELPEPPTLFDDWGGRGPAAADQAMTIARHLTEGDLKLVPPRGLEPEQLAVWHAAYEPRNAAFRAAGLEGADLVRWKYRRYLKDYARCVAGVDRGLGELLDFLEESGLAANTVVVLTSDQGFFLGEHGWYDKRFMYEEALRVPLVVAWPGVVPAGRVDRHLVQNLDLAPTFLELAGQAVPAGMPGRSLVPLFRGEEPPAWRDAIYYHYYEYPRPHHVHPHYGLRTERWKLIRWPDLDRWELFDLEADPLELHDLSGDPEHAGILRELQERLARLRRAVGDAD